MRLLVLPARKRVRVVGSWEMGVDKWWEGDSEYSIRSMLKSKGEKEKEE